MGSQGPGRKRTTSKNGLTAEEDALNVIAKEAEARLAAKRAARAEAREIRMKELERQQKEIYQVQKKYYGLDNLDNKWGDIEQWMVSDDEERMSVGSRSNIRLLQAASSHSHKKSKKKKKHSSKTSNGYDDDLSTLSSRSSRLSDESKMLRSSRLDLQSSAYYSSELYSSSSSYSSKHQVPSYSGYQGSLYEDSLYSGSRRSSARASSEYSGFLGSSSRTSSRANSACGSPVEDCSSSSVASFMRSTANISGLSRDLDRVIIPDLPNVNGRLSMVDDKLERDYIEKGSSRASTISGATLTSLGGTSSRRGSGDTSISADTEASIREIKEIHELKDQIQDVEAKHMQNLKELKDSLLEVEEKYRKAMVSNAQLDNEKTNMMYEVDTLKDSLMELEEMLFETRRELEEKCKDLEREKHAHSILQFQFSEMKETLKQSEELLTEIRQLRLKQDGFVREISDLQETIEWKNKKIGALERQKEYSDAIRNERDELRDEVVQLKDILKKHGIVLGLDLATNGETGEEVGKAEQNSQTASAEIREGSSVLGTHHLKLCKDQQQKDLDDRMQGNQQSSHAPFSSTKTPLEANENGDLGDQMNQGVGQLENRPEEPPSSVGEELTATRPNEEIKSEAHIKEDSRYDTEELECKVHKDGLLETDQQESECVKPSKEIKEETTLESVSGSIHDETDKTNEAVLDDELIEEFVEPSQMETLPKTQSANASNKKKKKKKKNKQKQKQSDKQESETKMDDKNEVVLSEDNPNQEMEGLEENHEKPLGNDVFTTTMNTDVPHDDKGTEELDCIEKTSTNINADDAQDKIQLVTDEADSAEISKTISNSDCPESSNDVLLDDLSNDIISNPANIIDDHTEDSTNPDPEPVILSNELMASEAETSLPHEPSVQPINAVGVFVESISSSENIENSSLVGIKEEKTVKTHLDCEVEEQKERLQNIDLDGDTISEDQDMPDKISSPVMENVENDTENVIQEQPIDQPMESQLQDSIGADVDQEEIKTKDELDEENLNVPSEKVFDGGHVEDTPLIETQIQVIHEDHLSSNEANQETVVDLEASDQEPKVEKVQEEISIQDHDGCHVEDTPLIETQIQDIHEDHLSSNEANQETVVDLEASDQEPKVEKVQEERSIQDHDGCHVEDTPLIETQIQDIHEDHLSSNEANQETVVDLEASDQEPKVEKVQEERSIQDHDGCHVEDTPSVETQIQVIHEDHLSSNEANQETVVDLEASEQEPKVEKAQEEKSIQDQVTINLQLPEDDEDLLVKSDAVLQELKEKDEEEEEEEDEGESFDFDEMDLEASSGAPLRNLLDQPNEDSSLLKENAQEASQECQRNAKDEDQTKGDECLEHSDQKSKPKEHEDDCHATENPQTATDVERCLTEDSETNNEVRPNDQQHDKPDAFEEHQQTSEDVTLSKEVNQISEVEATDVCQEIDSSIHHEIKASNISGEQEATGSQKENYRKESKKSGKGKGKGKGKEECKMS
ncbi:intracellular protein transport protein USO1 isoform X7 [Megalobrama amblycephala]|uniref:intracellular protein transport protein USO1 isoform X7 n=1 Tax=Megalobrama amblycephala TaxID=75352 RepID=UPI0020141A3C|nr:intracellular protein transport protein USO1 isoform X7 [Megalobrama amblycephala]